MGQEFRSSVSQKHPPQSHTYVGDLQHVVDMQSTKTVEHLAETVRDYIRSRPDIKSWGDNIDDIDFVVHEVRRGQTPIEPY